MNANVRLDMLDPSVKTLVLFNGMGVNVENVVTVEKAIVTQ